MSHVHPERAIHRKKDETNSHPEAGPSILEVSKIQPIILNYTRRQSTAEMVAKLCALDGFSSFGICNSNFIRGRLSARGFQLPKTKTNVMTLIRDHYELVTLQLIKKNDLNIKDNAGNYSV